MGVDYGEILCTAVDEIVTARLQGLSYDITKLCTIVDDSQSYQGKYVVSDGTARYEAYTTDNSLQKGNNILVTIPNGDYKLQKIIKGRVATTDTTPFKYESPLSKMVKVTENIFETEITESNREEKGLTANSPITYLEKPIYLVEKASQLSGFTRLGISADFRSLLNGYDVVSGTYGLKVLIQGDVVEKPGVTTKQFYELIFNSDDMVGNPYQFEIPFSQEKVFDISFINSIDTIEVYFYQGNNFINGSGERISPYFYSGISEKDEFVSNNLFVDNVQLFLGYDVNEFKGETLMIHTDDLLSYQYNRGNNEKNMFLRWIHFKDGESPTIVPANGVGGVTDKQVHWYRYVVGTENVDKYGGKNWERIPSDDAYGQLKCVFTPDVTKQTEQIKAIGIITEQTSIVDRPKEQIYYSNLLIFENEEKVPDQTTKDAAMGLSIECLDGSEGNYFVYNQNGKINNEGLGQGYKRKFKAMFNGAEITSDIGTLDWIKWYIPAEGCNKTSMIIMNEQQRKENEGDVADESVEYRNNAYWIITRKTPEEDEKAFTSNEQSYSISSQWTRQKNNNFVICKVSIDGVEYEATKQLNFGKAGTNGTNLTLVMEFVDNQNALIINDSEDGEKNKINVNTYLYSDSDGQIQPITDTNSIEYSWYKTTTGKDKNYIILSHADDKGKYKGVEATLECNINTIPEDNYYILQAVYNGKLTAYLPIPLKTRATSFIEGAREIIYDHQGIPSYYTGRYRLHYSDGENYQKYEDQHNSGKNHSTDWKCNYEIESTSDNISASYHPSLKEISSIDGWGLSAPIFFAENFENNVCVSINVTEKNLKLGWSQPILMMQSKYDFALLNDWDGSLTLNEENGTILSTMLGAGRKNSDNTFSGVLIGDIRQGTDLDTATTLTGVYGFQSGRISYSLTENGKATLGANGNGQIIIDGSESLIKTKGYDTPNTSGMKIDLNTGLLDIRNNAHESLVHLSAGLNKSESVSDPYFLIQTQQGKKLIKIDDKDYFLQSSNYSSEKGIGSRYDLMTGEIYVGGEDGYFRVTPSSKESLLKVEHTWNSGHNRATLLEVGGENYYLRSKDYKSFAEIPVYGKKIVEGEETEIEIEVGRLYSIENLKVNDKNHQVEVKDNENLVNFFTIIDEEETTTDNEVVKVTNIYTITTTTENGKTKYHKQNKIIFDSISSKYQEDGSPADKEEISLTAEQNKQRFLAKAIKQYEGDKESKKGFNLDLKSNLIEGYDLRLRGINASDTNKEIIIDSGASTYPLQIGSNFAVDWDGKVYCTNPTINGNNGTIQLGNFYINSNGAGGGTWKGYSTGVMNYSGQPLSNLSVTVLAAN